MKWVYTVALILLRKTPPPLEKVSTATPYVHCGREYLGGWPGSIAKKLW